MGSTSSHLHWIILALLAGLLYLVFDSARYFAEQLSPVRLRRWTGDSHTERGGRLSHYDPEVFRLLSASILQLDLVAAYFCTMMLFDEYTILSAAAIALGIWFLIVIAWKFLLALIPDTTGEVILHGLVPFVNSVYLVFWPLLYPLRLLVERVERRQEAESQDEEVTEEEVQAYIDVGEEEGILEGAEGKLVQSIVDFGDRVAKEIMTPRIDVLAFDANKPLADAAKLFSASKYSRIPIYEQSIDQITGILHIKEVFDVILRHEDRSVRDLSRPPYFVSETKKVSELLREFQSEHQQVAVVVDEYGGTAGIITIEDIVEEIVGDIADEHEDEEPIVVDLGNDTYLVSGALRVETLEETLDADLSGEDYETVAGLIFNTLGRVPKAGATVEKNGYRFVVDRADKKRIFRVRVSPDPNWNREDESEED